MDDRRTRFVDFAAGIGDRSRPRPAGADRRTDCTGAEALAHSNILSASHPCGWAMSWCKRAASPIGRFCAFRHGGQRGGDQAGAQMGSFARQTAGKARHPDLPRQLPRPHPGGGHRHRPAQVSRGVRTAASRLSLRGLQRHSRCGARVCGGRYRRGAGGAGAGRRWRHAGISRVPACAARVVRPQRSAPDAGRNPVRHGRTVTCCLPRVGLRPYVITLAKALGGGFPIGAMRVGRMRTTRCSSVLTARFGGILWRSGGAGGAATDFVERVADNVTRRR